MPEANAWSAFHCIVSGVSAVSTTTLNNPTKSPSCTLAVVFWLGWIYWFKLQDHHGTDLPPTWYWSPDHPLSLSPWTSNVCLEFSLPLYIYIYIYKPTRIFVQTGEGSSEYLTIFSTPHSLHSCLIHYTTLWWRWGRQGRVWCWRILRKGSWIPLCGMWNVGAVLRRCICCNRRWILGEGQDGW